ncbi:DUF4105 domain-containing protein [Citrobacter sp. JGM124]|uniref:Lnb N-terminal periplasmic domain-containing protein n=1 Tax=Citrobacter sp. JGM124 TaxID=2799789 RepID=UPI001BAB9419|nr:DUF4105 domain-containing protein [Citrobacter sp. JGM124]MBS0847354.1 DUF4105 domain-containing protein [Citrobacter sp. JGM124]
MPWLTSAAPSNDKDWILEYAKLPQVEWLGEHDIMLRNIRNFRYNGSVTDYVPAWYDDEFNLKELDSVDVIASYWSGEAIAHLFLSFGFKDGRHLAISIETRRSAEQRYSTWRGLFNHYTLTYVLADERDLIGVRTDVRKERVYLYPINISPEMVQALFLNYLDRIDKLNQHPEFYNTFLNNCTSNILNHAASVSSDIKYNWKVLVSGYADRYIYDMGLLDSTLPFKKLKETCLIQRLPDALIDCGYSEAIRSKISK